MRSRIFSAGIVLMLGCKPVSCDPGGPLVEASDPSAQPATVVPLETADIDSRDGGASPLASSGASSRTTPPPRPFEPYDQPEPDHVLDPEDLVGVVLHAVWRHRTPAAAANVPQAAAEAIQQAREATDPRWRIELSAGGRMRIDIDSLAQPLPKGTVLLSRADRYGTAIVWPDLSRYRVVVPGALRTVLGERRVDVSPLSRAIVETPSTLEPADQQSVAERLGLAGRKVTVRTALGEADLEVAAIPEAGEGAPLLCRLILELIGADPAAELCAAPDAVVAADIRWLRAGGIRFETTAVDRSQELAAQRVSVPPRRARFVTSGLPAITPVFHAGEELARFRTEPVPRPGPPDPTAPSQGLVAENAGHDLLFVVLDGVPVAVVPALDTVAIDGLKAGRYALQWRTFLGEIETVLSEVDLPARIVRAPEGPRETEKPDAG